MYYTRDNFGGKRAREMSEHRRASATLHSGEVPLLTPQHALQSRPRHIGGGGGPGRDVTGGEAKRGAYLMHRHAFRPQHIVGRRGCCVLCGGKQLSKILTYTTKRTRRQLTRPYRPAPFFYSIAGRALRRVVHRLHSSSQYTARGPGRVTSRGGFPARCNVGGDRACRPQQACGHLGRIA